MLNFLKNARRGVFFEAEKLLCEINSIFKLTNAWFRFLTFHIKNYLRKSTHAFLKLLKKLVQRTTYLTESVTESSAFSLEGVKQKLINRI